MGPIVEIKENFFAVISREATVSSSNTQSRQRKGKFSQKFELIPANNKFTSFLIVLLSSYMSSQYVKSFEVAVHIFKNLGGFSLISLR